MKSSNRKKWVVFVISALSIATVLLAACGATGQDLPGGAGGNPPTQAQGQGNQNPTNTPRPNQGQGQGNQNPTNTPRPNQGQGQGNQGQGHTPVTLCHATGSESNPYVEITVDDNSVQLTAHQTHQNNEDIIPAPPGGCPGGEKPTKEPKVTICHATKSETNPYVVIEIAFPALQAHLAHQDREDIYPVPAEGCPGPGDPTPTPEPTATPTEGPTATPTSPPPSPPEISIEPAPVTCVEFIVFHTFRDGDLELYTLHDGAEGDTNALLYNISRGSESEDSRPSRSPNDAYIVFETNREGNVELYYTDATGSFQAKLTNTNANNINAVFGADNQTVFFQSDRNGNWDLFSINLMTGEEVQLTTDLGNDVNAYASPDLQWLVFQSDRSGSWNLYLYDTVNGAEYQLTSEATDEIFPAWSPNGAQIAYLSDESGAWALYVINLDGSGKELISAGDATGNHSWSPEGQRLAYQSERDGNLDVYTYDLRDDTEYRLTEYEGIDSAPTWNCGGTLVSFTTERDGNPNVYQTDWQGAGEESNLTVHPSTDKWSEWTPVKEPASRGR